MGATEGFMRAEIEKLEEANQKVEYMKEHFIPVND